MPPTCSPSPSHAVPSSILLAQCRRMFLKFFPGESERAEMFVKAVQSDSIEISMAVLQSYFMLYRTSARQACEHAHELCEGIRSVIPVQQRMSEAAIAVAAEQRGPPPATPAIPATPL
mmetsp:Transcript_16958/g.38058  ORF Transcript_16958/g.38058 Transcript_16958/m.38058 type:complete len:118 (+) Transcript_16958:1165-1518(+)